MKEFEKLKAEYDATPIPQELNDRIQQGMRQGRRRRGPPCVGPPVSSAHRPGI